VSIRPQKRPIKTPSLKFMSPSSVLTERGEDLFQSISRATSLPFINRRAAGISLREVRIAPFQRPRREFGGLNFGLSQKRLRFLFVFLITSHGKKSICFKNFSRRIPEIALFLSRPGQENKADDKGQAKEACDSIPGWSPPLSFVLAVFNDRAEEKARRQPSGVSDVIRPDE
jgi:hypothetical protein